MKFSATAFSTILLCTLLWTGCSKETVEPNLTGSIEGQIQNSNTGEGIPFASLTTNPGTDAILSNENGEFSFTEIPTGNYTVQAEKDEYETKSVRVSVEQDRTATAQILMQSESEDPSSENLNAQVTAEPFNITENDSNFVEVEYMIQNTSGSAVVSSYEVYFQIYTSGPSFFQEVAGDTLDSNERDVGTFRKYIRDQQADSVTVSGVYAPNS